MPTDPFCGEIHLFGFDFAPVDWTYCRGAPFNEGQNPSLYSLIGASYGHWAKDPKNEIVLLPDLTSRSAVGVGVKHTAKTHEVEVPPGKFGGSEEATLKVATIPPHSHQAIFSGEPAKNASMRVSQNLATVVVPSEGDYLAVPRSNTFFQNATYAFGPMPEEGAAVGGVSGGVASFTGKVDVHDAGLEPPVGFPIRNPYLAMNICIALKGAYPDRN
ncbi:tail fiber protein [Nisaea acidiphila]|uniref:Tail fiber protein n=1 Tax=Nisaea acidiphila TaxID=1862145 RepID=A0A9J7ANW0_9PROT|nr:tail fiber protein [Nisaea acidiphila]UUX48895.1 tail fiber protein [Nisaea acidiphila]